MTSKRINVNCVFYSGWQTGKCTHPNASGFFGRKACVFDDDRVASCAIQRQYARPEVYPAPPPPPPRRR